MKKKLKIKAAKQEEKKYPKKYREFKAYESDLFWV